MKTWSKEIDNIMGEFKKISANKIYFCQIYCKQKEKIGNSGTID